MNNGALALIVKGGSANWSPERWKSRFDDVCRGRRVVLLPDAPFDPADIHYAAVWKPGHGELAAFPNLRVIFNLGAGVDALMADSSLPTVPLVRVAVGDLTGRMTEYVVLHVLMQLGAVSLLATIATLATCIHEVFGSTTRDESGRVTALTREVVSPLVPKARPAAAGEMGSDYRGGEHLP